MISSEINKPKIFVSYNKADRAWAEWIAWEVEEAGYQAVIQAWDFTPGSNFVLEMQKAVAGCERTIAVLSPDYLASAFTAPEWAAAFADDPKGDKSKLLPVRVERCKPPGLLAQIVYLDLVDVEEGEAKQRLQANLESGRQKPSVQGTFPGKQSSKSTSKTGTAATPGKVSKAPFPPAITAELPTSDSSPSQPSVTAGRLHKAFLFTDIVQSTDISQACWHHYGDKGNQIYLEAVIRPHDELLDRLISQFDGHVVSTAGDSYFAIFDFANDAVNCAVALQKEFIAKQIAPPVPAEHLPPYVQVRMGLHHGGATALLRAGQPHYHDHNINIASRIAALAQGEQILVSETTWREAGKINGVTGHYWKDCELKGVAGKWTLVDVLLNNQLPRAPKTSSLSQPSYLNVPERNVFFTGREQVLEALNQNLASDRKVALTGLGGIGKTQTTIEYAHRHLNEYEAVFWIEADTDSQLALGFAEIARLLQLPEKDAVDQQVIVQAVKNWFDTHDRWLLVLDNADTPELAKPFLPKHGGGHILLSSRAQVFDMLGIAKPIELSKLDHDEAHQFLLFRTGRDSTDLAESEAVGKICAELDCLPLALEQAGAYVSATQTLFRDYLVAYQKRRLTLLEKRGPVSGDYSKSVASTWAMNFEVVEQSPLSGDILRFSAFLSPDNIPLELLKCGVAELARSVSDSFESIGNDLLALDEALEPLSRYSLIRRDIAAQTYSIHRLVQEVLRSGMDEEMQREWGETAFWAVSFCFPDPLPFSNWPACEGILPHALVCAAHVKQFELLFLETTYLLNQTAIYLYNRGRYDEAEPLLEQAMTICEKAPEPEHSLIAMSLENRAKLHFVKDRLSEAEPLLKRALHIYEKVLGPEHPITATSLNNLASLYREQGRMTEAEPLFKRALDIREKASGPETLNTAHSFNSLALLYESQGKLSEAESLFNEALHTREKELGPEHVNIGASLNNLACYYLSHGRLSEAEALLHRQLAICEPVLGPEHPIIATVLNNIGEVYCGQGRLTEAEPPLRRALHIRERVLGPEHSLTAASLCALAGLCREQGRLSEATPLLERALNIREKVLGPEHPNTLQNLNNLAALYDAQGKRSEAKQAYQRALALCEKVFGADHTNTATVRYNFAQLLREMNHETDTETI